MADMIKFFKGQLSSLPTVGTSGALYITTDEGAIYLGTGTSMKRLGDFIQVDAVANLPTDGANASALYYCVAENILAKWNGSEWIQINKQPTADQIKTMIGLADYETKVDAAQKLTDAKAYTDELANGQVKANIEAIAKLNGDASTEGSVAKAVADAKALVDADVADVAAIANKNKEDIAAINNEETGILAQAKGYTDTEVAKVQEDVGALSETVEALDTYVGDIPEGYTQETVIAYINKKAEETLSAAQGGSSETAASVKAALDTYKADNDAAVAAVDDKADAAQTAADAAQAAASAAQGDVDAVEDKLGEVPDGVTVFEMIGDAEKLAGDAMNEAKAKVASVTAGDASITISGTTTAPTVAAKLSADADNALTLEDDGLKVVIPAAAEYVIKKAEESGEYAAIYKLMKDGVQAGASINIPKDMVVESGSVVDNPEGQPAGTYIKLVLQNVAEPLYINVGSLIEYVTSGSQTGDMIVVSIDDEHKVTAAITDGTVGLEKLTTDVQTKINKAHSHENADVLAGITADQVAAWDKAEENASKVATDLNSAMNARVEALEATDHEHANKDLLDTYTQTEANLADAVAKKHAHENADVLDGITAEQVAGWDTAAAQTHVHENKAELDLIAAGDKAKWDQAVADVADVTSAFEGYKTTNDATVALKADASAVYTKEEVDAAVEAALTEANSWGSF